jgi:hypothetical protein
MQAVSRRDRKAEIELAHVASGASVRVSEGESMEDWLEEKPKGIRERKEKPPSIKDLKDPAEGANQEELLRKIQKVADDLEEETEACKWFLEELRRRKMNSRMRH